MIRAEVCGSLRRRAETIGDLDILFSSKHAPAVLDAFVKLPQVATVLAHGPTKASVRLADGVQCDLRGVDDTQYPFALHYFTGSKAHNIAMRKRALARGLTLNEYALTGAGGSDPVQDRGRAVSRRWGWPRSRPSCARIPARSRPPRPAGSPILVELADLTGTFHCHTDWSDGAATLAEMAEAARARGMQYLGIADHSRSARLRRRAFHRAGPRAMGGNRRTQQDVRRQVSISSRGPSATSWPTARSTIPTSCSMVLTTWSRASTRISTCPATR